MATNPTSDEWTGVFGPERLTWVLLARLTYHVDILESSIGGYRLNHSRRNAAPQSPYGMESAQSPINSVTSRPWNFTALLTA